MGFDMGWKKDNFLKGLKITYIYIFLAARSDNFKSGKKDKVNYRKTENNLWALGLDIGGK